MKTMHAIDTPLDADRVFGFLADVRNEIHWRESVVGSRYVGASAPAVGVEGETDVAMGPKSLTMKWAIIDYSDGRTVAWRLDGDPWAGGGRYTVTAVPGGSRVEAQLEVRLSGAARVFGPLMGVQLRGGLRSDLRRLGEMLPQMA